ncbi:MAG: VOC family protein [Cohnella sp.]|nr:VOC family protein [Cohnella sp.]
MNHPILPFMPAVFIPVQDLKRATEWYADLLEQPIAPKQDGGGIYYFDFAGTDIILDSNVWGFPPTVMFDTRDIDSSHRFCEALPHGFMTEVQRFDDVSFFNVNSAMVCQAHRNPEPEHPKPVHTLLNRISRVLVHADDLNDSAKWFETFLQRQTETDPWTQELPMIRMDRGAHLLIDDNRLSEAPRVFYERLQSDFRVNPIAVIESSDLEGALAYVRSKGAQADRGIENRLGVRCFTFHDPDGNGLMVCEGK